MQILMALALCGMALNLALLMVAGGRVRRAGRVATALYPAANVAFVTVVGAVIGPSGWIAGLAFIPVLATGAWVLRDWTAMARAMFSFAAAAASLYVVYVLRLTFLSGLGPLATALSAALLVFEIGALALTLMYAYEALAVLCRVRWSRRVTAAPPFDPADAPFVSIHIPTYSEPPDLVIETLDALARLDYPAFEVIVVDNNTKDASLWEPVARHCAALGDRFRFFHVDPLGGFKAGACNFALARTAPQAALVAVIDADYVVDPAFLREVTPHFRDPRLAFVQTPQDYRQFEGNRYLTDCLHAYAYFFAVSMTARNEDNAPIFGGTMGLIRRSVLDEIGGWDEWCITEDAEASLRILQRGYRSLYVAKTYGRGLMPFDFDSYKKQRFRWAFGGIQIFRKHWRALVPFWPRARDDRLSRPQRLWYLAATLLWWGEPLQLAFAAFLGVGAVAYVAGANLIARPVTEALLLFPLIFLALGLARFLWVLRSALGLRLGEAVGAAMSMFSLSWVVTQAVLTAAVQPNGVFLRTSKTRSRAGVVRALQATRSESMLALACLAIAAGVAARGITAVGAALVVLCAWQALIYGSAFVTSLSAIRSAQADARPARYRRERAQPPAWRGALVAPFAAAAALLVFVALAGVANAPVVAEDLSRQPALLPQALVGTPPPAPSGAAPRPPVNPPVSTTRPPSVPPPPRASNPTSPAVTPTPPVTQPTPPVVQPTPPVTQPTPPGAQPTPPVVRPTPSGGPPTTIPTPRATLPPQASRGAPSPTP